MDCRAIYIQDSMHRTSLSHLDVYHQHRDPEEANNNFYAHHLMLIEANRVFGNAKQRINLLSYSQATDRS